MTADKFLELDVTNLVTKRKSAVDASAGSPNAGNIPALNDNGVLDASLLRRPASIKTGDYTLQLADVNNTVYFNIPATAILSLMAATASTALDGQEFKIKNMAQSTAILTIRASSGDRIEGATDDQYLGPEDCFILSVASSSWHII